MWEDTAETYSLQGYRNTPHDMPPLLVLAANTITNVNLQHEPAMDVLGLLREKKNKS